MASNAATLPYAAAAACIVIAVLPWIHGIESYWGHRSFKVHCEKGIRLGGGDAGLGVSRKTSSKAQCLRSCFARAECKSISYSPKTGQCYMSDSTKGVAGTSQDEGYVYCGPDQDEVWERTAITVELPTTTLMPTTLEPNECDSDPCQNGAACNDGPDMFTCDCAPGYEGTTCNTNTDECGSNPCQNGANCVDAVNEYACTCLAGYDGVHCETNINECASSPCQNGVCNDGVNSYTCTCSAGYEGTLCNTNTNECASSPCQNGVCNDAVNSYTCTCTSGYGGTLCDTNINECASSPCQHGACNDGVNSYTCTCSAGYEGTLCNTNTNECASSPCQNGVCNDAVNSYTCTCTSGYGGTFCDTISIRLVNGPTSNEGRVEVWHSGAWGTVCDDFWDLNDANVACRQLGYPYATNAYISATHGAGSGPIHLDDASCTGTEVRLGSCPHNGWDVHNCNHNEDASLKCYPGTRIRLVNGPLPNEGRVEVYHNGAWGTVCDDYWDINDGHVACRQLGYPSAAQILNWAHYGAGTGAIHLDDMMCTGSEASLGACSHRGWGSHNCGHSEDAGVKCNLT
ncbi:scavenger receptor cysteine-rich domain superfamily protein-like [Patiria miniata]|uniref:Uncharacterized protein n=1 Tax=Patiria miniata TaxID=46514 RepID=A0A914BI81_PATMI|nr:scavenger receptor cysteine-rich domain superfamily protein-like [Patiria miniata]